MKIYTRAGDNGKTSLSGGTKVPKNDYRIEACGSIDELNSWLGLLSSQDIDTYDKNVIHKLQGLLMTTSSYIADEKNTLSKPAIPDDHDIEWIETEIDKIEKNVPVLKSFMIPGGHPMVALCHVARSVCRRAERYLVPVIEKKPGFEISMKLLNRMSDYLYMLCRKFSKNLNSKEKTWNPLF